MEVMKKIKKEMVKPVTRIYVSERGLIPAVLNGRNEENDKKNPTKIETRSLWEINVKGGKIWNFFGI